MIRAAIIDDDISAIANLAYILNESKMVEVVGQFTNP
jgi:DNA-binding LytR/AlgR family response regulator